MSKITLAANVSGLATFIVAAPVGTGTDQTLTLPDATATLVGDSTPQTLTNKSIDAGQLTGSIAATQMNSTGSAPIYACRAWVNFNGVTGAIRASANVASVVRNSTGNYTITFTTAMPDANYAVSAMSFGTTASDPRIIGVYSASTGSVSLGCTGTGGSGNDGTNTSVAIFR